ncbi:MAG: hypothetical protein GF393_03325 [Armatimonadia bacterium]|nr:hypothetical protein [Armatimonadia bacterium]
MGPSEREEITFTREEFYEKVWTTPATRIAELLLHSSPRPSSHDEEALAKIRASR